MVATFSMVGTAAGAMKYYEKDGYYAKDDPAHKKGSFWHGSAAQEIGLSGQVEPDMLQHILEGYIPDRETRLGRIRDGEYEHRPGFDLTLSAPKSVSLAALVVGDQRIIEAHDHAVRATLDFVEQNLLEVRIHDPDTGRKPGLQHRILSPPPSAMRPVATLTRNCIPTALLPT